jgi:hypothetical protein
MFLDEFSTRADIAWQAYMSISKQFFHFNNQSLARLMGWD